MKMVTGHGVAQSPFDLADQIVEVARSDRLGPAASDALDVVIVALIEFVAGHSVAELDATDDPPRSKGLDVPVDGREVVLVVVVKVAYRPGQLFDGQRHGRPFKHVEQPSPTAGHAQAFSSEPLNPRVRAFWILSHYGI
jgi:hypothetical protein